MEGEPQCPQMRLIAASQFAGDGAGGGGGDGAGGDGVGGCVCVCVRVGAQGAQEGEGAEKSKGQIWSRPFACPSR